MRSAIVRVLIDPAGSLSPADYHAGVHAVKARGIEVIASPWDHLPDSGREIELVVQDLDLVHRTAEYLEICSAAFGLPATAGVTTFISRGTDDDAHGILKGFGIIAEVERSVVGYHELVVVTVAASELRRVPESRLHTALEAALNCEVTIVAS